MVKIISWNLDGLDREELEARTQAVIETVLEGNYDVVFFQELVLPSFLQICSRFKEKYTIFDGFHGCGYFVGTFVRKTASIRCLDHYVLPFPNTTMGRNLLVVKVVICNVKLALLNTHLESMLTSSDERKNQLQNCFTRAQNFPPEFNIFFGGDMRDWEAKGIVPENMPDLWIRNGSWLSNKYTWDLTENTNKEMPTDRQPQCRFDRFYLRDSNPKTLQLRYFGLGGQDVVKDADMFPSDHWAIIIRFSKIQSDSTALKTKESDTCSNWRA